MKSNLKTILLMSGSALFLLASCKKDESKVYYSGAGTAPVLTSSATDSISLPVTDTTATAVTFSWTNPNYSFSDGISSQNVTYYLEFDTVGSSFTNPKLQTISISPDLSTSLTVSAMNNIVADGLALRTGQAHNIQIRVESFLTPYTSGTANIAPLYSTPISLMVTPYATPPAIAPPPTGTLFVTGSATPQGWLSGTTTQQLTAVPGSNGLEFSLVIALSGGNEYKFIGNNNSYNYQYTIAKSDDPTEVNGGKFISGSSNNILAPSSSGNYLIDVNFQTGFFSVTPQ